MWAPVWRLGVVVALTALVSAGCATPDQGTIPTDPVSADAPNHLKVRANCLPGCIDPPPDDPPGPVPPGIFLSSAVTDAICFSGTGTDTDRDGLSDRCENDIAVAFAPQLAITGADRTGREPHWAAKPYPASKIVRIAYLLSYYTDDGPPTSWCKNNGSWYLDQFGLIDWVATCEGHYGDSEIIVLDVYYNRTTQRWLLDCAVFSAHKGWNLKCRGTAAFPSGLVYPDKQGGYPRSYVAYQKHANYFTDASCDAGSVFGSDNCAPTRYERVYAGGNVNIGSRTVHTIWQDCVTSTNPIYAPIGKKECYWTRQKFGGWQTGLPNSDIYSDRLLEFGF